MAVTFSVPFVIPSDVSGMSFWLNEHNLEHIQFANVALRINPRASMQLFDLGVWPARRNNPMFALGSFDPSVGNSWLDQHQAMHQSLSAYGGGGNDFTQVDPDDEPSWRVWEIVHAAEHDLIRLSLGIS